MAARSRSWVDWVKLAGGAVLLVQACGDGEKTNQGSAGGTGGASAGAPNAGAGGQSGTAGSGGVSGAAGAAGAAGSVGIGGAGPNAPSCEPSVGELGQLKLTPVMTGVAEPVHVTSPPGDTRRLFVVERSGNIWLIQDGEPLETPFFQIAVQWKTYTEKGLLGLAFHPDYEQNGLFYVDYVDGSGGDSPPEGDLVIAEYQRDPEDPTRSLPDARRELLRLPQATDKHKSGTLLFDRQARLYIAVGNAGEPERSADPSDLQGNVLRIDPSPGGDSYSIPRDNPLLSGWAPEVLESGLRNPWRITVDPCTDDLYMGDVGSEEFEEINIAPAGEHGHDYGFPAMEGDGCHRLVPNCDPTGLTMPVGGYVHGKNGCAMIGGVVYRGHAIPALRGSYVYGDFCSGKVYALRYADGAVQDEREITDLINPDHFTGITSFGTDAAGELYLSTRNEDAVFRVDPE